MKDKHIQNSLPSNHKQKLKYSSKIDSIHFIERWWRVVPALSPLYPRDDVEGLESVCKGAIHEKKRW